MTLDATRWHVNAPCGFFQHQDFFPCRCIPFLMINRKDIIPFTCNNDLAQSSPMQSHSELLRDIARVQGERKLREINPLTMKLSFELCQHANE